MSTDQHFNQALQEWAETFQRRSMQEFVAFIRRSGMSMTQFSALLRLHHCGSCGVSDLGEHLGVSNAAASQMADRLVQGGLLERSEDPHDRRAKHLTLTPRGLDRVRESIEVRRRWMEAITNALTPEEKDAIVQALTRLTETARELELERIER